MSDTKFNDEYFNMLKDRLIRATGAPGLTSFFGGSVHMTMGEWERLITLIEEDPKDYDYFVVPEYVQPEQVPSNAISMTLEEAKHRVKTLLAGIGENWKIVRRPALGAWEHMGDGKTFYGVVERATDTTPGAPYYGRHPDGTLAGPPGEREFHHHFESADPFAKCVFCCGTTATVCSGPKQEPDLRVFVPLNTLTYAATALEVSADNGDQYTARQIREAITKAMKERNHG